MRAVKKKSLPTPRAARTVERRSFLFNAGAVLSGTLASAAAVAAVPSDAKGAALEDDIAAIGALNRRYAEALNERRPETLVGLFAEDAEVHFNGGVFIGRSGLRRLYVGHFGSVLEDALPGRPEAVHTLVLERPGRPERIEVAADRRSAAARFNRLVQVEAGIVSSGSLADMARQQGQGVARWWEDGAYTVDYVRIRETWRIRRLVYGASPASAPVPGYHGTPPRHTPRFSATFPRNPTGPDRLLPDAADAATPSDPDEDTHS
jgi:SnoaL-like domain